MLTGSPIHVQCFVKSTSTVEANDTTLLRIAFYGLHVDSEITNLYEVANAGFVLVRSRAEGDWKRRKNG